MLEINKKRAIFNIKEVWFADVPADIKGVDRVIFRDCKNKINTPEFICAEHITFVIDLNKSLEEIWGKMSSTCQYEIRRAEREGIKVRINQDFDEFVKIEKLFNKTKKLLKRGNIEIRFMKKYGTLFMAELNGEVTGGQFYLEDDDNIRLLSAPSKRLNVDKAKSVLIGLGNRLMTWEAIKYARAKGIKEFDFGGYYGGGVGGGILDTPNLFKKNFGGEVVARYVCQKDYSKIYKILSLLKQSLKI